jgi:hypothetical protein
VLIATMRSSVRQLKRNPASRGLRRAAVEAVGMPGILEIGG